MGLTLWVGERSWGASRQGNDVSLTSPTSIPSLIQRETNDFFRDRSPPFGECSVSRSRKARGMRRVQSGRTRSGSVNFWKRKKV